MKFINYSFSALLILAAVAIAMGAYWHIYTLATCALILWANKKAE